MLSLVPVGSMPSDMAEYCLSTCRVLGEHHTLASVERAALLLKRLEAERAVTMSPDFPILSTPPYNRLLRAWARCTDAPVERKIERAQSLLQHMHDQHLRNPTLYPAPDDYTYLAALFVYICAAKEATRLDVQHDIANAAQGLIDTLEQQRQQLEKKEKNDNGLQLTKPFYEALLQVHAHQASKVYGATAAAEDILLKLSGMSAQHPDWQPDTSTFNRVLQAWSTCREEKGADRAYAILKLQRSLGPPAEPDPIGFGTVINAYARRQQPEQAEEVWKDCVHYFHGASIDTNNVNLTGCFNAMVGAWVHSGREDNVSKIQDLIESVRDDPRIDADGVVHASLIQALLQHGKVEQAHDYMVEMLHHRKQHRTGPPPLPGAIRDVVQGWSRCDHPDRAERVSQLLEHVLALNECHSVAYIKVFHWAVELHCDCCTSAGEPKLAIPRLLHLLKQLEQHRQADTHIYQCIINALCRVGTEESVHHACDVLQRFQRGLDDPRNSDLNWDPRKFIGLYTAVITALSRLRSSDAAERALAIFHGIPRTGKHAMDPTTRTYTSVLQAVAHQRNEWSAQIAGEMFKVLKLLDVDPKQKVKFDPLVFSVLMEASVCDVNLCHEIFAHMLELYLQGRQELKPDGRCKNAIIAALIRDGQRERAQKLSIVLRDLNSSA